MYNKHIVEGLQNYLKNGKYAINCYLKALDEQQWDAYYLLGNIYYWGEGYVRLNLRRAKFYYEKGIKLNNAKCLYALGRYFFDKKDNRKAIDLFEQAYKEIESQAKSGDFISQ